MKKKLYTELNRVTEFFAVQNCHINNEYKVIINILEEEGRLTAPLGEKVNKTLFAIRIIRAGNVRVFMYTEKKRMFMEFMGILRKPEKFPKKNLI